MSVRLKYLKLKKIMISCATKLHTKPPAYFAFTCAGVCKFNLYLHNAYYHKQFTTFKSNLILKRLNLSALYNCIVSAHIIKAVI